jgi:hypothetical protein
MTKKTTPTSKSSSDILRGADDRFEDLTENRVVETNLSEGSVDYRLSAENFQYAERGELDIPEYVQKKFENDGYKLRWVRWKLNGEEDSSNIFRAKSKDYYDFVRRNEIPKKYLDFFSMHEADRYGELLIKGDLALMKTPIGANLARKEKYENEAKQRIAQVNKRLIADVGAESVLNESSQSVTLKARTRNSSTRNFGE